MNILYQPEFELVVPAYNESKSLYTLIESFISAAQNSGFNSNQFQLIVVENGSTDDSSVILDNLLKTSFGQWFRVVKVGKNMGYGNGVWQGLCATTAACIGWSHADLQCDPCDAFQAFQIFKQSNVHSVLIKGVRNGRNWKDRFVSRVFELAALLILGLNAYEINAQPKIFSRDLLPFVKKPPSGFSFDLYVLYQAIKNQFTIYEIPVLFPPRVFGVSHWAATFMGRYKTILLAIGYMFKLKRDEGRMNFFAKKNKTLRVG